MKYVYLSLAVVFGFMVLACTGQSLGENGAGQDTYLEGDRPSEEAPDGYDHYDDVTPDSQGGCVYRGAIAVDHRTETAFVLQSHSNLACDAPHGDVSEETCGLASERGGPSRTSAARAMRACFFPTVGYS
jgi:hypothetical protein